MIRLRPMSFPRQILNEKRYFFMNISGRLVFAAHESLSSHQERVPFDGALLIEILQ